MVSAVALATMWLTLSPAGGAHPRARTAACSFTYVDATVYNETALRMDPYFFDKGFTNSVCDEQHPGSVQPHSAGHWKVGDIIFGTEVKIRYRLTNGDQVELYVFVYPGNRSAPLSCGWTQVVSSPRAYDCKVNWISGGVTGESVIQLRVFPAPPAKTADAAQSRSAAERRCHGSSALIGKTTNQTSVPLKLVSVSRGPADAWCRAPGRSQAAHSAGRWKLGGPRSGASARFVYRLPNGDDVDFAAAVGPRGGAIGCAPLDSARAALFGCRALRNVAPHSEAPSINLEVFPIGAR
jgi:hypothetical protein